jgi:hypothetical protein
MSYYFTTAVDCILKAVYPISMIKAILTNQLAKIELNLLIVRH